VICCRVFCEDETILHNSSWCSPVCCGLIMAITMCLGYCISALFALLFIFPARRVPLWDGRYLLNASFSIRPVCTQNRCNLLCLRHKHSSYANCLAARWSDHLPNGASAAVLDGCLDGSLNLKKSCVLI